MIRWRRESDTLHGIKDSILETCSVQKAINDVCFAMQEDSPSRRISGCSQSRGVSVSAPIPCALNNRKKSPPSSPIKGISVSAPISCTSYGSSPIMELMACGSVPDYSPGRRLSKNSRFIKKSTDKRSRSTSRDKLDFLYKDNEDIFGDIYTSAGLVVACIYGDVTECLSIILKEVSVSNNVIVSCLYLCIDTNRVNCARIIINSRELPHELISKLIKYSMTEGSIMMTLSLMRNIREVDESLLEYSEKNSMMEYWIILRGIFFAIEESEQQF